MSSPRFPIENFFPSSLRIAQCNREQNATPHFSIALGRPNKRIKAQIDKRELDYQEQRYGFTVLVIAVLTKNHLILKYALQKGARVDLKDRGGLTAICYAHALRDKISIKAISEKVGKIGSDFFSGGKEILEYTIPKPEETVCYSIKNEPITAQQFKEMIGAKYYPGVIGSPQDVVDLLVDRLNSGIVDVGMRSISLFLRQQYAKLKETPPRLLLGPQGNTGMGVFAGEQLKPFTLCGIYGGRFDFSPPVPSKDRSFTFEQIDGKEIRNLITMTNDSFPNGVLIRFYFDDGVCYPVFITIGQVEKGEPLSVHYGGGHDIKLRRREELNFDKMVAYFKGHSLNSYISEYRNKMQEAQQKSDQSERAPLFLESMAIKSRLMYLFHTPSALFTLILKEIVSIGEVSSLLINRTLILQELQAPVHILAYIEEFIKNFKFLIQISSIDDLEQVRNKMLVFLRKHSFISISFQFEYLYTQITRNGKSLNQALFEMDAACQVMDDLFTISFESKKIPEEILSAYNKLPADLVNSTFPKLSFLYPKFKRLLSSLP